MNYYNKFVKHYGVKGMKWGVRKEPIPSGGTTRRAIETSKVNQSTKAYMGANVGLKAENQPKTAKEAAANLGANQKKFDDKFGGSDSGKGQSGGTSKAKGGDKTLSDDKSKRTLKDRWNGLDDQTKSQLITAGVYAGLIGAAYIYGKKNEVDYTQIGQNFKNYAGKKIDATTFNKHVAYSSAKSWTGAGYINNESFTRSAFELPAGNTFYRLSTSVEDSFRNTTYATHNVKDYNRYVTSFSKELGSLGKKDIYNKTFTTKSPTKVPPLTEVLGSLNTILSNAHGGGRVDEKTTLKAYESLSGGSWKSPYATQLIASLKSKGYGALVDEMDAGVIGESPLVFFNSENASTKEIKKLSKFDKKKASMSLIELMNRKG